MEAGDIIVGVDIGSSKVCTIVGQVNRNKGIDMLGIGTSPCDGVKKGIIVDIDDTATSISNSIAQAEKKINVKISSAYVNIIGMHLLIEKGHGSVDITSDRKEITTRDMEKVLLSSRLEEVPQDKQIIDIIPQQYIIDGYDGIVDPFGMAGGKLEADTNVILGTITSVQNIIKSMEKVDVKVDGLIVECMATSEVLLSKYEKDAGTVLIDIGFGVTDISIFAGNNLVYYDSIPVGGYHITNDIAIALKIPYNEAERLKKQYAIARTSLVKNDQEVNILLNNKIDNRTVRISEVVEIIEARVEEIFTLINNRIDKSGYRGLINGNVVLTGAGIRYIDGSASLASEIMKLPVEISNIKIAGLPNNEFLTAYGIIKYVLNNKKRNSVASQVKAGNYNRDNANKSTFWSKISNSISEFFNI